MGRPFPADVGESIRGAEYRAQWIEIIQPLHEAAQPGGPLEGYLFHGCTQMTADSILAEGMDLTEVLLDDPSHDDRHLEREGTFWASPSVAAFYAEDRVDALDGDIPLCLIAVPREALEAAGKWEPDIMSVYPCMSERLGRAEADLLAEWDASSKDAEASFRVFESVAVLGAPKVADMTVIRDLDDAMEFLRANSPGFRR
jgi:hypothetical protein